MQSQGDPFQSPHNGAEGVTTPKNESARGEKSIGETLLVQQNNTGGTKYDLKLCGYLSGESVFVSRPGRRLSSEVCREFPQFLRENVRMVPRLGHDPFLPNSRCRSL
jgi:hypothetical protein